MTNPIKEFTGLLVSQGIQKDDLPAIKMNLREFMTRDYLSCADLPLLDGLMDLIQESPHPLEGEGVMDYLTEEISKQF